jgi:hypothetical protein
MTLTDLIPAVASITAHPAVGDLREATYLSTYPNILTAARAPGPIGVAKLHQVATMAYGWMPRIVRLDPHLTTAAVAAFVAAQGATPTTFRGVAIADLANCLRSVVGASKVLHFINPGVFPIWDSKVETFRLGTEPPYNHMNDVAHYLAYADEVHVINGTHGFRAFCTEFTTALAARLATIDVAPYPMSDIRVIEAAAFELAP